MKVGIRKPNIKKSVRAKTTGRIKRSVKKTTNPLYGKKGMGLVKDPKKSMYNKVYNKTTIGVKDIVSSSSKLHSSEPGSAFSEKDFSISETDNVNIEEYVDPTVSKLSFGRLLSSLSMLAGIIFLFFNLPLGIAIIILGVVAWNILGFYLQRHYSSKASHSVNETTNEYSNAYHVKVEEEHQQNSKITIADVVPFRNKPFSLSGDLMFDHGIPYFDPSDSDKILLEHDINHLIELALSTKVFEKYESGGYIKYVQIRTDIYTPTRKIKKYPISVFMSDEKTSYQLHYSKSGKMEKALLSYMPYSEGVYTIHYKMYSGSIDVQKICLQDSDGYREIYSK